MQNDLHEGQEAVRKVIGSALCDFLAYLSSVKDPFITGGQYPNDKLLATFNKWLSNRKFDITGANESTKVWLLMCQQNMFSGDKNFDSPSPTSPPPPPLPPPPPDSPPSQEDDVIPDEGYFNGEGWKSEDEQKERWQDEGEDWKEKGFNDDEFQPS